MKDKNTFSGSVLMPCPFCGGVASLNQGYYGVTKEENYGVSCDVCGTIEGGCQALNNGEEYAHATPELAFAAWNKRHSTNNHGPV